MPRLVRGLWIHQQISHSTAFLLVMISHGLGREYLPGITLAVVMLAPPAQSRRAHRVGARRHIAA